MSSILDKIAEMDRDEYDALMKSTIGVSSLPSISSLGSMTSGATTYATTGVSYRYQGLNARETLQRCGLGHAYKEVNYMVDGFTFAQFGDDQSFRDNVKRDISRMIADEVYKVTKFTQIKEAYSHKDQIKVIGRVIVMTEDEFKNLISCLR